MNSALFVVVLITGITLVAAALWIAGSFRLVLSIHRKERLTNVVSLREGNHGCNLK